MQQNNYRMSRNETIYTPILGKIKEMKDAWSSYITSGGASSHEDYRYTCGKIEALNILEEEVRTLEKKFIED